MFVFNPSRNVECSHPPPYPLDAHEITHPQPNQATEANDNPPRVWDAQERAAHSSLANTSKPEASQHSVEATRLEENGGSPEQTQLFPTQGNGNSDRDDDDIEHDVVAMGSSSDQHGRGSLQNAQAYADSQAAQDLFRMPLT